MVHSACATYVKAVLMSFNFLWLMIGTFSTYLGMSFFYQYETMEPLENPISFLILGGVILVFALLGFFGAYCESIPLLYIYGGGMYLFLLGPISYSLYMNHLEFQRKSALEADIQNGFRQFNDTAVARTLQFAQYDFECCGWNGPDDYKPILGSGRVPVSCCGKMSFQEKGKAKETCELMDIVYHTACKSTFTIPKYYSWTTSLIHALIAFIALNVLFMTCTLAQDVLH